MPEPFRATHDGFVMGFGGPSHVPHTGVPRVFPAITKSGKQVTIEISLSALGEPVSSTTRFAAAIRNCNSYVVFDFSA